MEVSLYSQMPGVRGHSRETMRPPLFKWASSSLAVHLLSMSSSLAQVSFFENVCMAWTHAELRR